MKMGGNQFANIGLAVVVICASLIGFGISLSSSNQGDDSSSNEIEVGTTASNPMEENLQKEPSDDKQGLETTREETAVETTLEDSQLDTVDGQLATTVSEGENRLRATAIRINKSEEVNEEIETTDDRDWFVFEVKAGQRVTVDFTKPQQKGAINIKLCTPDDSPDNGGCVDEETIPDDAARGLVADTAEATTRYYVSVEGEGQTTSTYSFVAKAQETDSFEVNERRATAANISSNTTITGELTENDDDWFTFRAEPGQRVEVSVAKPENSKSLNVKLFKPGVLADTKVIPWKGTQRQVADTAETSTIYYVRVTGTGDEPQMTTTADGEQIREDTTSYDLTVQTRPTDAFEPNENRATAEYLTPNVTLDGQITENDIDWFAFNASKGETIGVSLRKPNREETGLRIALFTPDESVDRAEIADQELQGTVSFVAQASTVYYVGIIAVDSDYATPYTLTVNVGEGRHLVETVTTAATTQTVTQETTTRHTTEFTTQETEQETTTPEKLQPPQLLDVSFFLSDFQED